MGNVLSSVPSGERTADHVTSESETMEESGSTDKESENEVFHDTIDEDEARAKAKEEEMEEFRQQLQIKREQRKEILARHRSEKEALEKSLELEIKAKLEAYQTNRQLRQLLERNYIDIPEELDSSKENSDITTTIVRMTEEFERLKSSNNKLRVGLAETNNTLQAAYSDIADLTEQNRESVKQINALREVISVSKTMIGLREEQLNELKNKLHEIERSLADREANMLSADLRQEYERQLLNIRTLRSLYEERARLAEVTRQSLVRDLEEQKLLKEAEIIKNKDMTTKVEDLEIKVEDLQETIQSKNNQIFVCQEESRGLQAEMTVVNKLFSQVLLGYKTKQDLDKLVHRLEENHGLLTHMAEKENGSEASSALPKLLLELVSQIDEGEENKELEGEAHSSVEEKTVEELETQSSQNTSAEEIVENLPKVWRVLIELLSHQSTTEENPSEKVTTCYKSVETNSGPVLVPSVSQTYIRLKDLILEKLALIKEVNRMKQLNVHLETRLGEQERRLCLVTTELGKTWHVVGRLRRHHHQLHTHEKILKYELQQKRKLLNELKEELEYCREKWEQAREKNTQTEKDWRKLRAEFSSRKTNSSTCNNSAESGYSDERPSDDSSESNDDSECVTEPLIKSKKKFKKSFETILDSSTDINLAEREDPASDLIDVADLPLDTQDGDDNHEASVTDSCSENINKSEKMCETEDEVGDIVDDLCAEETATTSCPSREDSQNKDMGKCNEDNESSSSASSEVVTSVVPVIDLAGILESIKKQNERLALKDKKLERLEKSGAALLKQTKTTAKISEQINSTLDHLLNRPTSSSSRQSNNLETTSITNMEEVILQESNATFEEKIVEDKDESNLNAEQSINTEINVKDVISETLSKNKIGDEKCIEVSSKLNSEMTCSNIADNVTEKSTGDPSLKLGDNDRNSQRKEKDCSDFLANTTATSTNEKNIAKMDTKNQQDGSEYEFSETKMSMYNKNESVPSSSIATALDANVAPEIDLAAIRKSNKEQNERLAIKDKKLETLEKGGAALLKQAQNTVKTSEQINNILDHLLERPTISSRQTSDPETTSKRENLQECTEETLAHDKMLNKDENKIQDSEHDIIEVVNQSPIKTDDDNSDCISAPEKSVENTSTEKNDVSQTTAGLQQLEKSCPNIAETRETINKNDEIIHKQDDTAACSRNEVSESSEKSSPFTREGSEQSSSSEIDHEARFAARDLRFKRLEEQTKSLVNKVNKTNSKGVKIHYKLQELHNIYGSQNSRAGTPSEDSDRSQNEEDTREHEARE